MILRLFAALLTCGFATTAFAQHGVGWQAGREAAAIERKPYWRRSEESRRVRRRISAVVRSPDTVSRNRCGSEIR